MRANPDSFYKFMTKPAKCEPIDLYHSIVFRPISLNYRSPSSVDQLVSCFLGGLQLCELLGGGNGVSSLHKQDKQIITSFPLILWVQDPLLKAFLPSS